MLFCMAFHVFISTQIHIDCSLFPQNHTVPQDFPTVCYPLRAHKVSHPPAARPLSIGCSSPFLCDIWPIYQLLPLAHTLTCSSLYLYLGYFECTEGVAHAEAVQAGSAVVDKWNVYMQDVMVMIMDPVTGAQPKMTQVFNLD